MKKNWGFEDVGIGMIGGGRFNPPQLYCSFIDLQHDNHTISWKKLIVYLFDIVNYMKSCHPYGAF